MPDDFLGLQHEKNKWPRAATFLSVLVTLTLVLLTLFTWQITGSVAILGALVASNIDLTTNIAAFLAARQTDKAHQVTHIRWFIQVIFIVAVAFLGWESARQLHQPVPLESGGVALLMMVCCLCLKILLIMFQTIAIRHTPSFAVEKDLTNHKQSILMYIGIAISIVLSVGWSALRADAAAGIIILLYILAKNLKKYRIMKNFLD